MLTALGDLQLMAEAKAACASGKAEQLRMAARLSKAEVARVVGVSAMTIKNWERCATNHPLAYAPSGDRAIRYGQLLRVLESTVASAEPR